MGLARGTGKGGMGSRLAPATSPGSTRSPERLAFWSCLGRPRIKSGEAVCGRLGVRHPFQRRLTDCTTYVDLPLSYVEGQ